MAKFNYTYDELEDKYITALSTIEKYQKLRELDNKIIEGKNDLINTYKEIIKKAMAAVGEMNTMLDAKLAENGKEETES